MAHQTDGTRSHIVRLFFALNALAPPGLARMLTDPVIDRSEGFDEDAKRAFGSGHGARQKGYSPGLKIERRPEISGLTSWSTAFNVLGKGERRQALKTPEQRMHEDIAENIRRAGQHIAAVFPRRGESGEHFFYTIGNAERRLPELLLIGNFPPEIVIHALNLLAEKMRKSEKPLPEGMVDIGWNLPFKVRKAGPAARADYTCQVDRYYRGVDYDVLQVMFCDRKGRYQDDPKSDYASPTP